MGELFLNHQNQTISIQQGLDVILQHFEQPIWPRTISTKTLEGRQLLVNSREEALARFAQAGYQDCRISAYPPDILANPSIVEKFLDRGLSYSTPKRLIVIIDLDSSTFTDSKLDLGLHHTLRNIQNYWPDIKITPSVIWSGRGYHVYLVMDSEGIVLERISDFPDKLKIDRYTISTSFLRFVEFHLSSGKSDNNHNTTVSFNNSMLRIPNSINSKNKAIVQIIQKWNNVAVPIKPLIIDFYIYLADKRIQELNERKRRQHNNIKSKSDISNTAHTIDWIEELIHERPIKDHRKFIVGCAIAPYLLNVRKVSYDEAFTIIEEYLHRCSLLESLSFNMRYKIKESLRATTNKKPNEKGYYPIAFNKLRQKYNDIYQHIFCS